MQTITLRNQSYMSYVFIPSEGLSNFREKFSQKDWEPLMKVVHFSDFVPKTVKMTFIIQYMKLYNSNT